MTEEAANKKPALLSKRRSMKSGKREAAYFVAASYILATYSQFTMFSMNAFT
jgi:hypothetical protein